MLVALGVLLYTPHAPDVNVCNQELDWGSIISGFEKLKLEADYQVRCDVQIHGGVDGATRCEEGDRYMGGWMDFISCLLLIWDG